MHQRRKHPVSQRRRQLAHGLSPTACRFPAPCPSPPPALARPRRCEEHSDASPEARLWWQTHSRFHGGLSAPSPSVAQSSQASASRTSWYFEHSKNLLPHQIANSLHQCLQSGIAALLTMKLHNRALRFSRDRLPGEEFAVVDEVS